MTGFGLLMGLNDNGEERGVEQDKSNFFGLTREQWGEDVGGGEGRVCVVYCEFSGLFV